VAGFTWKNICADCPPAVKGRCSQEKGIISPRKDVPSDSGLTHKDCNDYQRISGELAKVSKAGVTR
jgi:hypothetical protein